MAKATSSSSQNAKVLDPSSPEAAAKFRKDSEAYMARHSTSKASALAALLELGIVTKTGRLTKAYRAIKKSA